MSYMRQQALLEDLNYFNDPRVRAAQTPNRLRNVDEASMTATVEISASLSRAEAEALGLPSPEKYAEMFDIALDAVQEGEDQFYYEDVEVEVSISFAVCDLCEGRGKHVNPSIDASGISAEDFDEDPEFYHHYRAGHYDVACNQCKGRRVMPVVPPGAVASYLEARARDDAEYHREMMAELRMGC